MTKGELISLLTQDEGKDSKGKGSGEDQPEGNKDDKEAQDLGNNYPKMGTTRAPPKGDEEPEGNKKEDVNTKITFHKEIVFDYIWTHHLTGTPLEKQHQLEEFADGGIEYMKEIFVGDNLPADKIISDIGEKFSTPKEQD